MLSLVIFDFFFLRKTCANELARAFHTTKWRDLEHYEQDWFEKYTFLFQVKVGEYVQVAWKDVLADAEEGTFVPLDPNQSWFDHFLEYMTDGQDYTMSAMFERMEQQASGLLGFPLGEFRESDIFRDAPGCGNGVDLEGNLIENILLQTNHETQPSASSNRTEHRLNFTVSLQGRPLEPYEDALAIALFSTGWQFEDFFQTNGLENSAFLFESG